MASNSRERIAYKIDLRMRLVKAISEKSPFPLRTTYHHLIGLTSVGQLYNYFPPAELSQIEAEALEIKRRAYSRYSEQIDKALVNKCLQGDAQALRLYYQRFESLGEKREISLTGQLGEQVQAVLSEVLGGDKDESSDVPDSTEGS